MLQNVIWGNVTGSGKGHSVLQNFFPTEQILAPQERLSSMKLLEVQILDFNMRVTLMHCYTFPTYTDAHGLKTVTVSSHNCTFIKLILLNTKYIFYAELFNLSLAKYFNIYHHNGKK
jgi:hypothetical protein